MTNPGGRTDVAGRWYAAGDVNAFFGLAVDNLTNLVVLAGLLVGVFGFPADLVFQRIIPGTALGVLVGDLWYTWLARRLSRETGRADVTAMPFGIDTPSLFGITFGVLGPTMLATRDPVLAWKVGMGVTVVMGVAKLALAFAGGFIAAYGAKIAKGCTSGQALTGGSILNVGSLVFMIAVFAAAYGLAWFVRKEWL